MAVRHASARDAPGPMTDGSVRRARLAAAAFAALPCEAAVIDSDGVIVLVNEAWREFGRRNGAGATCGIGVNYLQTCERAAADGDMNAAAVGAAITAVLEGHAPQAVLDYPCHSPSEKRWFQLRASYLGGRRRVLVLHDDITARVQENTALRNDTMHDPLTGLANRALLHDRLAIALADANRRLETCVAVLVIDLDDITDVTASHGPLAGNALLRLMARRLEKLVRAGDTVARWGNDNKIALVLPGCTPGVARELRKRVTEAIAAPLLLGMYEVTVTACTGIAIGRHGQDGIDLLTEADHDLIDAKAHRGLDRANTKTDVADRASSTA